MAGLFKSDLDDFDATAPEDSERCVSAKESLPSPAAGNFKDLERLLEQLGSPPVFELGNPLPQEKFMPKRRIGECHASHNRALFGETD
jgi:hypothetical protein